MRILISSNCICLASTCFSFHLIAVATTSPQSSGLSPDLLARLLPSALLLPFLSN